MDARASPFEPSMDSADVQRREEEEGSGAGTPTDGVGADSDWIEDADENADEEDEDEDEEPVLENVEIRENQYGLGLFALKDFGTQSSARTWIPLTALLRGRRRPAGFPARPLKWK
jgi:hypothetical protein